MSQLLTAIQPQRRTLVVSLILAIVCGSVFVLPQQILPAAQAPALAVILLTLGLLATGLLAEHLSTLLFFLLAMLLHIATPTLVFSGFASAAFWLVFSGLVLGIAVKTTGLGERLAKAVAARFSLSYAGLIAGVLLMGLLLGFVMPSSMGRAILLIPIAIAIADHFGFAKGSNGRRAIVLAAAFGSHVPTFAILPANVPNLVLTGAAETLYGTSPLYGEYLLLHFPVLGLLKGLVILGFILWLYPDQQRQPTSDEVAIKPWSLAEKKLLWVLILSLGFWMSDSWHHISPAWIGLAGAVLLLWPRLGVVSSQQFNQGANYNSVFFVAGILGLGAVVSSSGLGAQLARLILSLIPLAPDQPMLNFASLGLASLVTGLATTLPGVPAVMTPLADSLAHATGLPLKTILMTQVLGFSTTILPYQSAPLVVAMQLADERLAHATRLCLLVAVVTLLVLWPLDYLWWRELGWI